MFKTNNLIFGTGFLGDSKDFEELVDSFAKVFEDFGIKFENTDEEDADKSKVTETETNDEVEKTTDVNASSYVYKKKEKYDGNKLVSKDEQAFKNGKCVKDYHFKADNNAKDAIDDEKKVVKQIAEKKDVNNASGGWFRPFKKNSDVPACDCNEKKQKFEEQTKTIERLGNLNEILRNDNATLTTENKNLTLRVQELEKKLNDIKEMFK